MSSVTWQTFRDTEFSGFEDAAELWVRYIRDSVEIEEALFSDIEALSSDDSGDFDGLTADATRAHIRRVAEVFVQDLTDYAERIKQLLYAAGEDFEAKRGDLVDLLAEAGAQLVPTGGIGEERFEISTSSPSDFHYTGGTTATERQEEHLRQVERAEAFTEAFRALMADVRRIDDDLASELRKLDDDAPDLPPTIGAPDYSEKTAEYLQELHQDFLDKIESGEATPEEVNEWWNSLSEGDQELFVHKLPELVGPVDGIPTEDRNTANRNLLDQEIASFSPTIDDDIAAIEDRIAEIEGNWSEIVANGDSVERAEELEQLRAELSGLQDERATLHELEDLQEAITGQAPTGQDYYLLGYDSAGDGKAIVSVGNPDEADNTVVYVPGTGGDLDGASGNDLQRAETMAEDASQVPGSGETAVVMWLDYDAPNNPLLDSPSLSYAKDASEPLASFMSGLDAADHDSGETTTTVMGHSYGTTVIGQAASEHGLDTDLIVAVASPGMTVDHASELGIDPDDFYSTTAPGDIIGAAAEATLILGPDPNDSGLNIQGGGLDSGFGGTSFESENMDGNPVDIHSNYWDDGNVSRENMALIFTGNGGQV